MQSCLLTIDHSYNLILYERAVFVCAARAFGTLAHFGPYAWTFSRCIMGCTSPDAGFWPALQGFRTIFWVGLAW